MRLSTAARRSGCDVSTDISADSLIVLDEAQWRARQQQHRERTEPWVAPRRDRRQRAQAHPVDDFLFDYYPYSVAKLTAWHPGIGVSLRGDVASFLEHPAYRRTSQGVSVDPDRLTGSLPRLRMARRILSATAGRPPQFGCFGLHEWAMVHGQAAADVRHSSYPLRVDPEVVVRLVAEQGLRCTHIDAYRFFTPSGLSLNAHEPTRATQHEFEQPGCLHANMDLYKYAMWFSPFIRSELIADCFELAREARQLDMRAAPYDLAALGLVPILIETAAGRREYVERQRDLSAASEPLRARLLEALSALTGG